MDLWKPIEDFPGYSVGKHGQVRNDRSDRILKPYHKRDGHIHVAMFKDGIQLKRGLARLVGEAFVQIPERTFTTPIHLDGQPWNCQATNLMWRPRWFAWKYTRQFGSDLQFHPPVRDTVTEQVFEDLWELVTQRGILLEDIIRSAKHHSWVFPTYDRFEWA